MRRQNKRLAFVIVGLVAVSVATWLILSALSSNLVFFYSPTQVLEGKAPIHHVFRIGGVVEHGTVHKDGMKTTFTVTDLRHSLVVHFKGILPDLFRAGQGVVVQGRYVGHDQFAADQVLAKHGANYMPPNVRAELKHSREVEAREAAARRAEAMKTRKLALARAAAAKTQAKA